MRVAAAVVALVAACEADTVTYPWRVVTLPSGGQGAAVNCTHDLGQCYERAGRACPTGYDVLDKNSHVALVGEGRALGYGNTYDSQYVYNGTLLIRCRAPR